MHLTFEADPHEYLEKRAAFLKSLAWAVGSFDADLSDLLEKAGEGEKPESPLKYPALEGLRNIWKEAYREQCAAMIVDIGKVLDQSTETTYHKSLEPGEPEDRDSVYRSFFEFLENDDLEKGLGHKYVRRMPTGRVDRPWRYIYSVIGIAHFAQYQVGEKVRAEHEGKVGHFEVLRAYKDDSGQNRVEVRHDESGKTVDVSSNFLHELVHRTHAEEINKQVGEKLDRYRDQLGQPRYAAKGHQKMIRDHIAKLEKFYNRYSSFSKAITWGSRQEVVGWAKTELDLAFKGLESVHDDTSLDNWRLSANNTIHQGMSWLYGMQNDLYQQLPGKGTDADKDFSWAKRAQEAHAGHDALTKSLQDFGSELHDFVRGWNKHRLPTVDSWTNKIDYKKLAEQRSKKIAAMKGKITRAVNQVADQLQAVHDARVAGEFHHRAEMDAPAVVKTMQFPDFSLYIHEGYDKKPEDMEYGIRGIRSGADRVKAAGFGKALEGLVVHVETGEAKAHPHEPGKQLGYADTRKRGVDVMVHAEGFSGRRGFAEEVMIHELGHRYYYRALGIDQRNEWRAVIDARKVTPTKDQIAALRDTYLSGKMDGDGFYPVEIFDEMKKSDDPVVQTFGNLLSTEPTSGDTPRPRPPANYVHGMLDRMVGHPCVVPFVSWYAGNNHDEYWAEAFTQYVTKSKPLPAWTQAFFDRMVRATRVQKSEEAPEALISGTNKVLDVEARAYARIKAILKRKGYLESDFEGEGPLAGKSANELFGMVR